MRIIQTISVVFLAFGILLLFNGYVIYQQYQVILTVIGYSSLAISCVLFYLLYSKSKAKKK